MSRRTIALVALLAAGCNGGQLEVTNPRVLFVPGSGPLAGYFDLHNGTGEDVRLTNVSAPDFGKITLHRTVIEKGVSRMQHVEGLAIESGSTVRFEPGGLHLMLIDRQRTLSISDQVLMSFSFEEHPDVQISFPILEVYSSE